MAALAWCAVSSGTVGLRQEAYLYHVVRRDPRHNFSPLYYPTYLSVLRPDTTSWLHRCSTLNSG